MASTKGIVVTVGILAALTAASFAIWLIPQQGPGTVIVVSDNASHLDRIDAERSAMAAAVSEQFAGVLDGSVPPADHIASARESSVIVKRQIAELFRSGAGEQWHASYSKYVESLRSLDEYIGETAIVAGLIADGREAGDTDKAAAALAASEARAAESLAARPQ